MSVKINEVKPVLHEKELLNSKLRESNKRRVHDAKFEINAEGVKSSKYGNLKSLFG